MNALRAPFQRVVLVCNTERPEGSEKPSCGHHGAAELRGWLKREMKAEGIWGRKVRVLTTSCLDICPNAGVICSFDGGESLEHVDAETERDAVLERIRGLASD